MLREITISRKSDGDQTRRWFQSERMDLFVWCDPNGGVDRFQLAYDKPRDEKVVAWKRDSGYTHARVDEGRSTQYPGSPMFVKAERFARKRVAAEFARQSRDMDRTLADFIHARLIVYFDEAASRRALEAVTAIGMLLAAIVAAWRLLR